MKTNKRFRDRGDTLLEVVVAMVILSSILTSTFTILNRAISTNVNVKNRIIALNIAREGMEAVRNLRDTNWLKYSGDRRGKWLCRDSEAVPNACNQGGSVLISDGTPQYYIIDYSTTDKRYYLANQLALTEDLDLTSGSQVEANQEYYRLNLDTGTNQYVHDAGVGETSLFYREILLQAVNPYDEETTKPGFCDNRSQEPDCFDARLKVRVGVYWMEDDRPRKIFIDGHLFDFFERKDYN